MCDNCKNVKCPADKLDMILDKNIDAFNKRALNCAETVLLSMCDYLDVDNGLIPRIATAFGAGMGGSQSVCGTVTGGLMALGILTGREKGGDQTQCKELAAQLMRDFYAEHGTLTCMGLTGLNLKDPIVMEAFRAPGGKHHTVCVGCARWVCRYIAQLKQEKGL